MKAFLKLGSLFTLIIVGRYMQLTTPAATSGLTKTPVILVLPASFNNLTNTYYRSGALCLTHHYFGQSTAEKNGAGYLVLSFKQSGFSLERPLFLCFGNGLANAAPVDGRSGQALDVAADVAVRGLGQLGVVL